MRSFASPLRMKGGVAAYSSGEVFSFSFPNTELTSTRSSTGLVLGVGTPNTSSWLAGAADGPGGGDFRRHEGLAAILLDLGAFLGGAVDLEVEVHL